MTRRGHYQFIGTYQRRVFRWWHPQGQAVIEEPAGDSEPFFEDDFSTYTPGQNLFNEGDGSFTWGGPGAGAPALVTSDIGYNGRTQSLMMEHARNDDGGLLESAERYREQRFDLGRNCPHLWFEMYCYFPNGNEGITNANAFSKTFGGSNKFINHWGVELANPTDADNGYNFNYCGDQMWPPIDGGSHSFNAHFPDFYPGDNYDLPRGSWARVRRELAFSSGSGVADGISRIWINDDLVEDLSPTGSATLTNDPSQAGYSYYYRFGYLGGDDSENHGMTGRAPRTKWFIGLVRWYDEDPGWM